MKIIRLILTYLVTILFLIGFGSFVLNIANGINLITINNELPLDDIQNIIEKNDKIYIGLGRANRVQVYNYNGKFLYFNHTDNYSKDYDFFIDSNEQLSIKVIYLRKIEVKEFKQENGNIYKISSFLPITLSKNNNEIIIQPWYYSLFGGIFEAFTPNAIILISMLLILHTNIFIFMRVFSMKISPNEKRIQLLKELYTI